VDQLFRIFFFLFFFSAGSELRLGWLFPSALLEVSFIWAGSPA